MCGLVAYFNVAGNHIDTKHLTQALLQMRARGPDAEGRWQEDGAWLGHRRLAIMDLDPRAQQPMHSACGRYVIVFNGEIYNFRDLRSQLVASGVVFRTTSGL